MKKSININPVTRISGFLEIKVQVENNRVVEVKTIGNLFRGFEKMLQGRQPLDAIYFTQRICGICSAAHSTASSLALEEALLVTPSEQGRYLRDILHGCEFLQNHIRHFYQYTLPDYVSLPEKMPLYEIQYNDYRLPKPINDKLAGHYFESLEISCLAHEMLAVLGGKAPHNHGIFVGGVTTQATTDKIVKMKALLGKIRSFIHEAMLPDARVIAAYYNDYFKLGAGYGNLLSYGCFDAYNNLGNLYVRPSVYHNGTLSLLNPGAITEEIGHSWYSGTQEDYKPYDVQPEPDMGKAASYTWVKSPRYKGLPYETGPLARQWLSGGYRNGISAMDRTLARVYEARQVADIIGILLQQLDPGADVQIAYKIPDKARGSGLVDTTRGALGHWLAIEHGLISHYQIVTPSAWNLSAQGDDLLPGTAEKAILDTILQDEDNPAELGRIIRSFDPCVSCATHVCFLGGKSTQIVVCP